MNVLLPLRLVTSSKFVKKLAVHFHKGFENVIDKSHNSLIPVFLANPVQRWEHYSHYHMIVLFNQRHNIFIVPVVQCSLSDLKNNRFTETLFINIKYFNLMQI